MGGVGGAAVLGGVLFLIRRRRRAAAAGHIPSAYAGGAGYGATATIANVSIKTRAKALAEDTGISSSPRASTLTPRSRV